MRQALDKIAERLIGEPDAMRCNWGLLRFQHTMAIRAWLLETYKPATANKLLSAMRGVLKATWLLGYLSAEDYQKAVTVPSVKNETLPTGREIENDEIAALLNTCYEDQSPTGQRDAALIGVLYGAGLRRAEIIRLNLTSYYASAKRLIIQGKGLKERNAWLNTATSTLLNEWLIQRGTWSGPLFCPINKSDKIIQRRLTTQAVYYILQKRSEQATVTALSPHDLRRTFVSKLLDAGADIATVSKMVGHANIQTTLRYDRRSEESKKQAADLLHIPSKSPKTQGD